MKRLRSNPGRLSAATLLLAGLTASCAAPDEGAGGAGRGDGRARLTSGGLLGSYDFLLEVAGITPDQKTIIGGFKSLSGMDSEGDKPLTFGGLGPSGGFEPGGTTVTFEAGASPDAGLLEWYKRAKMGLEGPHGGTITVLDQDLNTVVAKYAFEGALPISIVGAPLGPTTSAVAIEKVELVIEKIERVTGK
jgi:hypothetical protein